jgi:hypothetical protein
VFLYALQIAAQARRVFQPPLQAVPCHVPDRISGVKKMCKKMFCKRQALPKKPPFLLGSRIPLDDGSGLVMIERTSTMGR